MSGSKDEVGASLPRLPCVSPLHLQVPVQQTLSKHIPSEYKMQTQQGIQARSPDLEEEDLVGLRPCSSMDEL